MQLSNFARIAQFYFSNTKKQALEEQAQALLEKLRKRFNQSVAGPSNLQKYRGGYIYYGRTKTFIPEHSGLSLEQKCMLGSLICAEGNWSSINTYDDQGFTLGIGFSAMGDLPKVLEFWFTDDPSAKSELESLDICFTPIRKGGLGANWEDVRLQPEDLKKIIRICESPIHNSKFVNAQLKCLLSDEKSALRIPDYAKNWDLNMLIAGVHLSHWMRRLNWNIQTDLYKNCLDVADVLSCAYNRLGINNSRAVKCHTNGCFVVPYQYGIGRIKTWGNGEQMIKELTYKAWKGCPVEGFQKDVSSFPKQLLFCLPQDKERPADIAQYLQYDRNTLPK